MCDKDVVVGIDFGTYGSLFSFAFKPACVVVSPQKWDAFTNHYAKSITVSLFSPGVKNPTEIGYKALNKYTRELKPETFSLLEAFKLRLLTNPYGEITDPISKRTFSVLELVSSYLAKLNEYILKKISDSKIHVDQKKILYVFSVPAIWTEKTLQAMRLALYNAKITTDVNASEVDCIFVTEAEAASATVKEKHTENGFQFDEGTVYMVVDAGGGTVDLTVHKIENNKLNEVTIRSGSACGSVFIDKRFYKWLEDHFEEGAITQYFNEHPDYRVRFQMAWEYVKNNLQKLEEQPVELDSGFSAYLKTKKRGTENTLTNRSTIIIPEQAIVNIFQPVDEIVELVDKQVTSCAEKIQYIILVGGFGTSDILFDKLKERFANIKIIRPHYPVTAVVYGATLIGASILKSTIPGQDNSSLIGSRRAVFTCIFQYLKIMDTW